HPLGTQSHDCAAGGHSPLTHGALAADAWGTEVRRKGARARRARRVDVFCGWIHHDSRPRFAMDPPAGDTLGAASAQGRLELGGSELTIGEDQADRKSTRLNSSHVSISYAVFCL